MEAFRHALRRLGTAPAAYGSGTAEPAPDHPFSALYLLHSGGLGGASRAAVELCRQLVAHDVELRVVVADDATGLVPELIATGAEVVLAEPRLSWWTIETDDSSLVASGRDVRFDSDSTARIVGELRERPADLIITQSGVIPHGAYAAAALDLPHVWMVAEVGDPDHGASLPFAGDDLGAVLDVLSDLVVAPSEFVQGWLGLSRDRTLIVPPPIDGTGLTGIPPVAMHPGVIRVASIGSLASAKGHTDVIAGLATLVPDHEVQLRITGEGTAEQFADLERCIADLAMTGRVTIDPPTPDRRALYADADVVVVASRNEAFGLVVHEAALAGRPVVYAASGGVAETMTDGVTGLAFEAGDVATLTLNVRRLVEDETLRERLVRSARAAAVARINDPGPFRLLWDQLERLAHEGARNDVTRELIGGIVRTAVVGREESAVLAWRLDALLERRVVRVGLRLAELAARLRR